MKEDKNTIARIGIFSGRPNPEIKLEQDSAKKFAELVKSTVGKEPTHAPPPAKLGEYYGFLVFVPSWQAKELMLPEQIQVFSGVLTIPAQKKSEHWKDVNGVEKFLIRQAFDQGHGALLQRVNIQKP